MFARSFIRAVLRVFVSCGVVCGAHAPAAFAQAVSPATTDLPVVFAGIGLSMTTSDADSRMRLYDDPGPGLWQIEGGVRLARRIGIGAEFSLAPDVSASTSGQSFRSSGTQEERVLVGMLRVRAASAARWALDVVGGAGVLFQHHELRLAPCFSGCVDIRTEALDRDAPAWLLGADIPIHLAPHFVVSSLIRWYLLQRGDHVSEVPVVYPWQYEWTSSTRFAVGVSARLGW